MFLQEKIVQELNEIFEGSDRDPTMYDVQNMKYMERVIHETMRLWPPIPLLGRYISEDHVLKCKRLF